MKVQDGTHKQAEKQLAASQRLFEELIAACTDVSVGMCIAKESHDHVLQNWAQRGSDRFDRAFWNALSLKDVFDEVKTEYRDFALELEKLRAQYEALVRAAASEEEEDAQEEEAFTKWLELRKSVYEARIAQTTENAEAFRTQRDALIETNRTLTDQENALRVERDVLRAALAARDKDTNEALLAAQERVVQLEARLGKAKEAERGR
jgi:hypothetical protein